jgi:hypothetical protein
MSAKDIIKPETTALEPFEQIVLDKLDEALSDLAELYTQEPSEDLRCAYNELSSWRKAICSHFFDHHLEQKAKQLRDEIDDFINQLKN